MTLSRFVLALLVSLISTPAALAQTASDDWHVTVAPYLMGAGLTGAIGAGPLEAEIDASISEVFSHLEFGIMGIVAARKGAWGVGVDGIYSGFGVTADRPPADIDVNQTLVAGYALRRLNEFAELTFGARLNYFDTGITLKNVAGAAGRDQWWIDPIAGVILQSPARGRLTARVYGEIGGFGLGSTFAWQLFPGIGIAVADNASLDIGYRWVGTDYESGDGADRFVMDTLMQGPVIGFSVRF